MKTKGRYIVLVACVVLTTILLVGCADPVKVHMDKAGTYWGQGKFDEAIGEFTEAIELNPDVDVAALAYVGRAACYHSKGDRVDNQGGEYDKAIADCNKAIELGNKVIKLDPESNTLALAYYQRGWVYSDKDEDDKAIADFENCIEVSGVSSLIQMAQERLDELRA